MSRLQCVLFDVDDTLYRELDFVHAAMGDVAAFVAGRTGEDRDGVLTQLLELLAERGRGDVFDTLLASRGLPSAWVAPMLYVYRCARPALSLYDDAGALLTLLRRNGVRTGIVTDGVTLVQHNKVRGLGLEDVIDAVVYTDTLGPQAGKPSPTGFEIAMELLGVTANRTAYVANDVRKDFIAPRALGMTAVLVRRGILGDLREQPEHAHPHHAVDTLGEVAQTLNAAGLGVSP